MAISKSDFSRVYKEANEAGLKAVENYIKEGKLKAMTVSWKIGGKEMSEYVSDGPCGFAWVNVKPGNSSFARWLKEKGLARSDSYYGGVTIWIGQFNQSMQKKEVYAEAFADVLRSYEIKASHNSRMD